MKIVVQGPTMQDPIMPPEIGINFVSEAKKC